MPELEQKQFQRQVAHKTLISSVLSGNFAKDDASAGYIRINDTVISRVNIMANLVYKSEDWHSGAIIDDGSGKISLRNFENSSIFAKVEIGDVVLVIGKVREFNSEVYIMPEIIRKIDDIAWFNARKLELKGAAIISEANAAESNIAEGACNKDVYEMIKKLDSGDGVDIGEVIGSCQNKDAEAIIGKLLENGDIFEVKPGKIKVLE
ncbi:hypothetical protein HYV80_00270 [Candidatus Woesearchaeota archaeon]|nr:hypothetical protein [Candidatus Woesearchaeota archaeon]